MQAHSKQKPEQSGTRKLPELYGSRLTYVRHRYDEYNRNASKRSKLSSKSFLGDPNRNGVKPSQLVQVRGAYGAVELRRKVK